MALNERLVTGYSLHPSKSTPESLTVVHMTKCSKIFKNATAASLIKAYFNSKYFISYHQKYFISSKYLLSVTTFKFVNRLEEIISLSEVSHFAFFPDNVGGLQM